MCLHVSEAHTAIYVIRHDVGLKLRPASARLKHACQRCRLRPASNTKEARVYQNEIIAWTDEQQIIELRCTASVTAFDWSGSVI